MESLYWARNAENHFTWSSEDYLQMQNTAWLGLNLILLMSQQASFNLLVFRHSTSRTISLQDDGHYFTIEILSISLIYFKPQTSNILRKGDLSHNLLLPEPFLGQFFSPSTAESLEPLAKEVGRIIYQNDSITVNWGLVVAALVSGLLCKLPDGWGWVAWSLLIKTITTVTRSIYFPSLSLHHSHSTWITGPEVFWLCIIQVSYHQFQHFKF